MYFVTRWAKFRRNAPILSIGRGIPMNERDLMRIIRNAMDNPEVPKVTDSILEASDNECQVVICTFDGDVDKNRHQIWIVKAVEYKMENPS